jgi:hypothetical protein
MIVRIPTQPLIARTPLANIAEYTVNTVKTGIIQNLDFIEVTHFSHHTMALGHENIQREIFGPVFGASRFGSLL